jgi:hypothetical protein
MKPLHLLLIPALLFLSVTLSGQNTKSTGFDFFAKGQNSYSIREMGYWGQVKIEDNGVDHGHSNDTYIDIDWRHWLGNGFGAGLKIYSDWSGTHPNNSDQLSRTWTISPNISYGKTLTDRWGMYATGEFSFGKDKSIYKSGALNFNNTDDVLGYSGSIAFPYRFSKYTALTMEFGYDHIRSKGGNFKQTDNSAGFSFFLEDYLRCNQIKCDHSTGFKLSINKYDQGRGFIQSETQGKLNFGSIKQSNSSLPDSYKSNYTNADLDLKASYYIIDHLALGGAFGLSHRLNKSDDNSSSLNTNGISFDPEVIINLPADNGWRNLFAKGGGYFGANKNESKSPTGTNTFKTGTTGYNIGVGYYAFLAEETALQTCVYFRSITIKDKDSEDKTKQHGLAISIGLAHSF